ncbi:hypothetical protein KY284_008979 [Solanum tuberosum]|nr:hypothetical protein KY284_008979 [Solanum tuberosum]
MEPSVSRFTSESTSGPKGNYFQEYSNVALVTSMASSSSSFASDSQYRPRWKYDVFLSFRGVDTRRTFMGHLYEGLKNRGIFTFQDDKRLENGDSIPEELLKAIEESRVALVIFSKNYATSRWCLNELVKIIECKEEKGLIVIPVFYDVYPSEVRKQTKSFAEAFTKHESKYANDIEGMQMVKGWRTALSVAADLKGYDISNGIESDYIQHIVDQISVLCKGSLSYIKNLVGIDTHLKNIRSLLAELQMSGVLIVGIWGMPGVGKTTIARAIFDRLSYQFEAEKVNCVNNKEDGRSLLACRLRSKKVLVVLDDIDHIDQLDYLAGNLCWFGNGSRIIATTRDKHVMGKNNVVYEVPTLHEHDAVQLFEQYAFKEEVSDECFKELTLEVVSHAKGLPLALKVFGSFFHNRDITEWRSAIKQIKNNPNSEIVEKLKISYDGLETIQQSIFLDIACFLRGRRKEYVMQILESCDFGADIGLSVLIDKSLMFISEHNTIEMHDLIQDMGKYVVKMQKDPGECSRLWLTEDFEEVMINNTHLLFLQKLDLRDSRSLMQTPDFTWMPNLKYLDLSYCRNLESVHYSLGYSKEFIELNLYNCGRLKRFPCVNVESLIYMDLEFFSSLEKFPKIFGTMKPELKIKTGLSGIKELPSSIKDEPELETLLQMRGKMLWE